jgi:hypothetical protein
MGLFIEESGGLARKKGKIFTFFLAIFFANKLYKI